MYPASIILETYTMDFTARVHFARRGGAFFTRVQVRDPRYGYRWTRWTPCAEPGSERTLTVTGRRARLPR
jgi:hypothetical protein